MGPIIGAMAAIAAAPWWAWCGFFLVIFLVWDHFRMKKIIEDGELAYILSLSSQQEEDLREIERRFAAWQRLNKTLGGHAQSRDRNAVERCMRLYIAFSVVAPHRSPSKLPRP